MTRHAPLRLTVLGDFAHDPSIRPAPRSLPTHRVVRGHMGDARMNRAARDDRRPQPAAPTATAAVPGKRTLTESLPPSARSTDPPAPGRGTPVNSRPDATAPAEHAEQRELSVAQDDARRLEITQAPSVKRYGGMLAAVLAAQHVTDRAPDNPQPPARVARLLQPFARRLDQLNDDQGRLGRFGAGNLAGQTALDMSQAAIDSWLRRLKLGARIRTDELVTRFRAGAEPIRFLTGERRDAPTLRAFDRASHITALGAAGLVLAPALLAVAAEEAPLLAIASRAASQRVVLWALTHPAAALAASEALLGFGVQIGQDCWQPFW